MSANPEFDHAVKLAHKVLERHSGDPDDDLAVLARQFLRSVERETGTEVTPGFDWDTHALALATREFP